MKIKTPQGFPPPRFKHKGKAYLRNTRYGAVIQSWPKARGFAKTGWRIIDEWTFAYAARYASTPLPQDLIGAIELSKGSDEVPRDFLMKAALGTLITFVLEDGTTIEGHRMGSTNASYVLDQLGTLQGSIPVRGTNLWDVIAPPAARQMLISDEQGVIKWQDWSEIGPILTGSWTPAFATTGTAPTGVTYTSRNGKYVNFTGPKLCWIVGDVIMSSKGTGGTGNVKFTGLPATSENTAAQAQTFAGWSAPVNAGAGVPANAWQLDPGLTEFFPIAFGNNAGPAAITWAQWNNATRIRVAGFFKTT